MKEKLTARDLIQDACDDLLTSFGKDSKVIKEFIRAKEIDPEVTMQEVLDSSSDIKYAKKDRPD